MTFSYSQEIIGSSVSANRYFGNKICLEEYFSVITQTSASTAYLYQYNYSGSKTWDIADQKSIANISSSDIFNRKVAIGSSSSSNIYLYNITNSELSLFETVNEAGKNIGDSVAISDKYIAAGDSTDDSNKGLVYVYDLSGDTVTAYSDNPIYPTIQASGDYFGYSVCLNGDYLFVGAYGDNTYTGAVYIYKMNLENDKWEEFQKIVASDGDYNDKFGWSIDSYGDYLVVGSPYHVSSTGDLNSGCVYIFKNSGTWIESDKIVSGEDSTIGHTFGYSVSIDNKYLVVGSPGAGDGGKTYVFSKLRSWDKISTLESNTVTNSIDFGKSVANYGDFILVADDEGSIDSNTKAGFVDIFYNKTLYSRLAQEFSVNKEFVPSKASIYLDRIGKNISDYWTIYNDIKNVIDCTNFSDISKGENRVIFNDEIDGFTGNGYMILNNNSEDTYDIIEYPIKADVADTFYLWIRVYSQYFNNYKMDILLDDVVIKSIDQSITNPSEDNNPSLYNWEWLYLKIIIPDTDSHTLGIKIKEQGIAIDKLYIDSSYFIPIDNGPSYSDSPYFTTHLKLFTSDSNKPKNSLFVYDFKSSIDNIVTSDWYNYDIKVLDNVHGYTNKDDFDGEYFIVLAATGTFYGNFIVWRQDVTNEYEGNPSSFKLI